MLERTFVHVQGIGYSTERRLWTQGADCWNRFLGDPTAFKVPKARLPLLLDTVSRSPQAVGRGDYRFFQQRLKARDHWRALRAFPGRVAYLDIETDGGTDFDNVTVIGLYDGSRLRQFVRGENLLDFDEALDEVAMLVTFYGNGFDLPVLRRAFPRVRFDQLHLDLCPALRRLGLGGGLKSVEAQLGISRSAATTGLSGWDAVRLWREWRRGSREARELLLAYNAEDVVNMAPLAEIAFAGLSERLEARDELREAA
ncbi:MAG TPA: ribonuclease H-like domain-containing protein [Armatimonadota bacterium]|nr:ribonuclease H-like domain-containing protein [Armatimonadota bacterium]